MVPRNKLELPSKNRLLTKSYRVRQGRTLHIHQGKNPPTKTFNSEHLCPKCKGIHIHKRNFTKAENTYNTTLIVEDFNTTFLLVDRSLNHKLNREKVNSRGYEPNGFNRCL